MKTDLCKLFLFFVAIHISISSISAEMIAYDPFVNAEVGNGENDKLNGEYNAGSFFRDFTNGNNKTVAGGQIIGWSASNEWAGNSYRPEDGGTSQFIGPTEVNGLVFGANDVQGGATRARGYNATGGVSYARRLLDTYEPSNVYYISALLRADNLSGNLSINAMTGFTVTVSHGAFDGSSNFAGVMLGFAGDGSKVDLVVRHRDDNILIINTTLLENAQENETYFVVVKIEYNLYNTLERLTAWLNPTNPYEENEEPVFITTGQILTSIDQMAYGGFWLNNFTSSLTDYVYFDELRLGTQWLDAVPVAQSQTISEMAVSDYSRPEYAPKESDVCYSSRWLRGEGYNENAKWWGTIGTEDEKPLDSLEVMKMYHATRLEWMYLYGDEISFIPKVRGEGVTFAIAQTHNLRDNPGGVGAERIGRIISEDGNYALDSIQGRPMGCVNHEIFKQSYLREAKVRIDEGATSVQLDSPNLNDPWHCYCEYCEGEKDGFEATTEFYQLIHSELDNHYLQNYGIAKFPIHGNNSSHTVYSDSFFGIEDDYRLDFGCSETNVQDVSAQHFYNVGQLMRSYQGISRAQIITSPGTWGYSQPVEIEDFHKIVRRSVATCYGQGINMLVPFDRFAGEPVNAGDEVQGTRFFGNPQNFADMFGFIRGIAIYLDDYQFAWSWGKTPKAVYRTQGTPFSDFWGKMPRSGEPVVSVDDGVAVIIRAKPGANDDPIAMHLIDWNLEDDITITLNNESYFADPADNLRFTLLEPLDNYDAEDYAATWSNLNYTYYVKTTVLNGSYENGRTTVSVPQLNPWAVLMVSKGKNEPLPLYNSPRWQQLKDNAPAVATAQYPANNNIATPIQSIMLAFDKELASETITADNFVVKHEQTGRQISGSWVKIGSMARFTPSTAYPKGTISVQLTPELKRSNGAPCLRQKFYYSCNINVADVNDDYSVDLLDFSDVATGWLTYTSIGDVTSNGYVGFGDVEALAENWLNCYVPQVVSLYPADDAALVCRLTSIKWATDADYCDIYFGSNRDAVENAQLFSPEFKENTSTNTYVPGLLAPDTTYYWRIDPMAGGCVSKGQVYSFTTTTEQTLAYWELDSDGSSAVGRYSLRLALGQIQHDSVNYASITNPDTTTPWNSASGASQNFSSLYFDGSTALVGSFPDSPYQFKRSSSFTCEAYIRPTAVKDGQAIIFGTRDGFTGWMGWYLWYDSQNQSLRLMHSHPGGATSASSAGGEVPLNVFKHVALVWDSSAGDYGQIRGYVDGIQVMQTAGRNYWFDEPGCGWNFMVGGRNLEDNEWGFIGNIDEVRYSNYALEPSGFLNASNP